MNLETKKQNYEQYGTVNPELEYEDVDGVRISVKELVDVVRQRIQQIEARQLHDLMQQLSKETIMKVKG